MLQLKRKYILFIEKNEYSFFGKIMFGLLYLLSFLYGFFVNLRNFLYDKNILKSYNPDSSFLIGVGNISWAGTGKTPLSLWLYENFSSKLKTAILRRGYGEDEKKLIKEKCLHLFSSPDRRKIIKSLEKKYELFIIDDAFQYRKLKKDIEIVIMRADELRKKRHLIPASSFREPLQNAKRADILIVNYKDDSDCGQIKKIISELSLPSQFYFARYRVKSLQNLRGEIYNFELLKNKKVAAFAAIGYPRGFFRLLIKSGISLVKEIVYPDHHILSKKEYCSLENELIQSGIKTLITTDKDRYHFPEGKKQLDIFVLSVKLEIEREAELIDQLSRKIAHKSSNS